MRQFKPKLLFQSVSVEVEREEIQGCASKIPSLAGFTAHI